MKIGVTMKIKIGVIASVFALMVVMTGTGAASSTVMSTIDSNFNGNSIEAGNFIWFNNHMKVTGISEGTVIKFSESKIEFTANDVPYSLNVPESVVTFSSGATPATTFDGGAWKTTLPVEGSDEIFLSGLKYEVEPGGLPGGINPVTWSGSFECLSQCSSTEVKIEWKWGAAVYTKMAEDYNALGVEPIHNTIHAGTPVNVKDNVIGGARGGGGSNFEGSWSSTKSLVLSSTPPPPVPELSTITLTGIGVFGLLFIITRRNK
jgi:hypothetical protein